MTNSDQMFKKRVDFILLKEKSSELMINKWFEGGLQWWISLLIMEQKRNARVRENRKSFTMLINK